MASRELTNGEILMARRVFGNSIPYVQVRIYNEKWSSLQSEYAVVTPNGNLYYPPGHPWYAEDFSLTTDLAQQYNFMHEMAHVWQKYRGGTGAVIIGGIPSIFHIGYNYTLDTDKQLSDYGLEAQANILADYYFRLINVNYGSQLVFTSLQEYQKVLADFLKNPSDRDAWCKPAPGPYDQYR